MNEKGECICRWQQSRGGWGRLSIKASTTRVGTCQHLQYGKRWKRRQQRRGRLGARGQKRCQRPEEASSERHRCSEQKDGRKKRLTLSLEKAHNVKSHESWRPLEGGLAGRAWWETEELVQWSWQDWWRRQQRRRRRWSWRSIGNLEDERAKDDGTKDKRTTDRRRTRRAKMCGGRKWVRARPKGQR